MSHWLKIYDHSKRGAQNHSWTFMAHWCSFLTPRIKSFMLRKIYVSFMSHWLKIYDHSKRGAQNHSWTFIDHWCSFMTQRKSHSWQEKFMIIFDPKKSFMLRKIYDSFMIIFDQRKSHSWQEKFMIIFD